MSIKKQIKKINQTREEIFAIEKERGRLLQTLFKNCELIEGCFREVLVRCGCPTCHCQAKPLHPVTKLSRWEDGKLRNKVVRVADREFVTQLSNNYKEHKQALSNLAKINKIEHQIMKTLMKLKITQYV